MYAHDVHDTKIVKFVTPVLGVQALEWGQYGNIVKCIKNL